jgi:hypothetical protein
MAIDIVWVPRSTEMIIGTLRFLERCLVLSLVDRASGRKLNKSLNKI